MKFHVSLNFVTAPNRSRVCRMSSVSLVINLCVFGVAFFLIHGPAAKPDVLLAVLVQKPSGFPA
jgi:hypothetical protein